MDDDLASRASDHVQALCTRFPDRHVGGAGNAAANDLFEHEVASFGFEVESTQFECLDWRPVAASIDVNDERFELHVGPYSLPCDTDAPLASVSTVEDLESGDFSGAVLLLHGEIAREQLMPKNFTFYNPASHRRIIVALEAAAPAAIIAATGRDPGMVGAQYPFPLFEDGDFDLPNAYIRDVDGERMLAHVGVTGRVRIDTQRIETQGRQLVARKLGSGERRIVVFAHIDSRDGTPGALDNAGGVAVLLVLAELLAEYSGTHTVELVPLNGEDYYAASGQMVYLGANEGRLSDITLGMNVDDAGHVGARTAVSYYGCSPQVEESVRAECLLREGFLDGPAWPQGDHSILVMNGVPAVAFTSEDFLELLAHTTHTPSDVPELVDARIIADIASVMAGVIGRLG